MKKSKHVKFGLVCLVAISSLMGCSASPGESKSESVQSGPTQQDGSILILATPETGANEGIAFWSGRRVGNMVRLQALGKQQDVLMEMSVLIGDRSRIHLTVTYGGETGELIGTVHDDKATMETNTLPAAATHHLNFASKAFAKDVGYDCNEATSYYLSTGVIMAIMCSNPWVVTPPGAAACAAAVIAFGQAIYAMTIECAGPGGQGGPCNSPTDPGCFG